MFLQVRKKLNVIVQTWHFEYLGVSINKQPDTSEPLLTGQVRRCQGNRELVDKKKRDMRKKKRDWRRAVGGKGGVSFLLGFRLNAYNLGSIPQSPCVFEMNRTRRSTAQIKRENCGKQVSRDQNHQESLKITTDSSYLMSASRNAKRALQRQIPT